MPATPALRAANAADAARMAAAVTEGLDTYRSFMPAGWEPPAASGEREHLDRLLGDPATWCLLAEAGGRIVGQVSFLPADRAVHPVDDPALAHLRNLFVDHDHWGSELARTLHDAALAAARERGFATLRLFTPAEHGRARRFYEREGWAQHGVAFDEPALGMALVEYRYALEER